MKPEFFNKHFPVAVFGTLRCIPRDQGNASLMFLRTPLSHKKCFIPHFVPNGIRLSFKQNACGIAELFFYDPKDWNFILSNLDELEGFNAQNTNSYYYHRTLINVKVLPDDYADNLYSKGILFDNRDLKISRDNWKFPSIAAWVYSSIEENNICKFTLNNFENPIIFD